METERRIPKRQAAAVINSLKGGVVPRMGLPYITVGRKSEIEALLHDIDIIESGGAGFRFIVGRYGSGKSFLLQTIRSHVMDRGFVVVDADLTPERRLQGTKGQGLATYRELIRNMSTKTRPEGGALPLILDRWINAEELAAAAVSEKTADTASGGSDIAGNADTHSASARIHGIISEMNELVHGFDFAKVLTAYYEAHVADAGLPDPADGREDISVTHTGKGYTEKQAVRSPDPQEKKARALKWLRGEYTGRTEARNELGVNAVITDEDWYDYLKLMAYFVRKAGYSGMLILIDELVNIYKIPNLIARQYNYEKILTMYNDALQGKAQYLGVIMSGTPQCVEDRRRGIYSYEALRSRLQEGRFSREGARDMFSPVIRLEPLTAEEMLVLAGKLADIHAVKYDYGSQLSDEELADFIKVEYDRIGTDINITPREVIRDLIELLDILYQHPEKTFTGLLHSDEFEFTQAPGIASPDNPPADTSDGSDTATDGVAVSMMF